MQLKKHLKNNIRIYRHAILAVIIILAGFSAFLQFYPDNKLNLNGPVSGIDKRRAFNNEIFDKVKENYWEKIEDKDLANLYELAVEKVTEKDQSLSNQDKEGVLGLMDQVTSEQDTEENKNALTAQVTDIVLANLKPFGRSRLYTTKQKQDLQNTVTNSDPNINLYSELGVNKDTSQEKVEEAYQKKIEEISQKEDSPEKKEQLASIGRAFEALSTKERRERYDTIGAEPTVLGKYLDPKTFYIPIKKYSPTTFNEFIEVANSVDEKSQADSLILDLRGNIGGAIDILPYFLGPFIGQNQYAYEFFHQGEYKPYKTQTGWLESLLRYKKVVVLIDGETQSSGEVMASVLKKYNVGILVGTKTKGWGTVEQAFPIEHQLSENETYSAFMVHSITLRDDNQPVEGRGIDPTISIEDPDWAKQLMSYFNEQRLVDAVRKLTK